MRKVLLLVFIHGFKGGDTTFGTFPEHITALVQHALPKLDIQFLVYPAFETRGALEECVSRFRDWLLEKVIDIEVQNHTPSPTVDPSVRTVLIGHSMGGIVAADTLLALTNDLPIDSSSSVDSKTGELNSFMFPYVQGVLAFDTPYLGISPGVVAHGAEEHYNAATSALTQLSGLTGAIWGAKATAEAEGSKDRKPVAALPAPPPSDAPIPMWQKWGKVAAIAGAGAAVVAAGGAAYLKREEITSGWTWATSHLEFVGCLMKGQELQKRVAGIVRLNKELHVGFGNLYTRLGKKAVSKSDGKTMVGSVIGNQRTFCNLPKKESKEFWHEAINDEAGDETWAHMSMFYPKDNPGFYAMSEDAKKFIVEWTTNDWYESSTGDVKLMVEHEEL